MLDKIPDTKDMIALIGQSLYSVWLDLNSMISKNYDMDCLWNNGGKAWVYEYKYRRGGKTLCALYAKENCIGFMVILGKNEQLNFETNRETYSKVTQEVYDQTKTYRDGKWLLFNPKDHLLFDDFIQLLVIKRKPNRPLSNVDN